MPPFPHTSAEARPEARSAFPDQGFGESSAPFTGAASGSASRFEDSVRLQRLFAAIDDEARRQAVLHLVEAMAADDLA